MCADAATLRCPSCGAVADPQAVRCRYCQARLATVSCPSCFALMFAESAFCPKCGTARARRTVEETAARCPACKNEVQRVDIGTTPLYECSRCDGMWVDADVFERLCADQASQAAVLPRLAARQSTTAAPVRYRPCLRCGKMMNRVNFGALSGAVVDVCKGHGTFLDAGELHQIVSFIQGGGLDRARQAKIEEARAEQRRLSDLKRRSDRYSNEVLTTHGFDPLRTGYEILQLLDLIRPDS